MSKSSQSPQTSRGTSRDFSQFSKGSAQFSAGATSRVAPENRGAEQVKSNLSIESVNSRADKV
jgi:hypothetical protein